MLLTVTALAHPLAEIKQQHTTVNETKCFMSQMYIYKTWMMYEVSDQMFDRIFNSISTRWRLTGCSDGDTDTLPGAIQNKKKAPNEDEVL